MENVHVGRGTARGALGVFPVWGEVDIARDYSTALSDARVIEKAQPDVATLMVANAADRPLLLLEGQVLESGWQNRMIARSLIVAPNDETAVGVVCVEAGRWNGLRQHADSHRRAATRVQAGLRAGGDRQSEVWKRVSEYDARYGRNDTSSFVEHANRAAERVSPLVEGLRPFPGQIGVVIAVGGYPVSAELFGSPLTLAEQFSAIVAAAAMDAVERPGEVTPSRRVRRFIAGAANVHVHRTARAGAGSTVAGANDDASISLLRWRGRDVHTSVLNPRHELIRAS
ncbi:ARPP-1 family domain-containing protein [Mycobacterium camsae]|uniref:ARPP-1 family domain-containing protein n=1 Tax=Mycobacterium gordonae TaxID=1778 RepID=UPI00197D053D|nr:DUF6569 family protein [Mycobacterium gordonae]